VDPGPGGGDAGEYIVAEGKPEEVAKKNRLVYSRIIAKRVDLILCFTMLERDTLWRHQE